MMQRVVHGSSNAVVPVHCCLGVEHIRLCVSASSSPQQHLARGRGLCAARAAGQQLPCWHWNASSTILQQVKEQGECAWQLLVPLLSFWPDSLFGLHYRLSKHGHVHVHGLHMTVLVEVVMQLQYRLSAGWLQCGSRPVRVH